MQVCAIADVTDEEILAHCNADNPQETAGGWHAVIRTRDDCVKHEVDPGAVPGDCAHIVGRKHFIALCM